MALHHPKTFKESLKILEADIQHANDVASWYPKESDGVHFQMRLAYSPVAPFLLCFFRWTDCSLAGALGLLHILIYKVHMNGSTTMAVHEKRASLRQFYGYIYPSLQQLQGGLSDAEIASQRLACQLRYKQGAAVPSAIPERERKLQREIERECGICLEDKQKVALPSCGHVMCVKCFRDWQSRSASCPFCRRTVGRVASEDLWVLVESSDTLDPSLLQRIALRRLLLYLDKLPVVLADNFFAVYDVRYC
eukprot:TRINITY_DN4393_c0_g1_i1.p1 TRINITY_DN4393_c0_g1~~TRINITY_DN4393_c0_g1_i1.p1  ORF type:complete len:250 (+),score=41.41 TRINITY_DN4393_c0_g1_i1:166-915(+)